MRKYSINDVVNGITIIEELDRSLKYNRLIRKLKWELDLNQFLKLILSNCYYCNSVPIGVTSYKHIKRNGIDRIDNNIGYYSYNCVSCCAFCNTAKSNKSAQQFLQWVKNIYDFKIKNADIVSV